MPTTAGSRATIQASPADRELEVRTKPGPRVPLTIAIAREIAVVEVSAHRRDLVEEPADRHLGCGRLGQHKRSKHREDNYGKDCCGEESSHSLSSEQFAEIRLKQRTLLRGRFRKVKKKLLFSPPPPR